MPLTSKGETVIFKNKFYGCSTTFSLFPMFLKPPFPQESLNDGFQNNRARDERPPLENRPPKSRKLRPEKNNISLVKHVPWDSWVSAVNLFSLVVQPRFHCFPCFFSHLFCQLVLFNVLVPPAFVPAVFYSSRAGGGTILVEVETQA